MKGYNKLHYGWLIVLVGVLVVAGSLGFGRFSYSMILPAMQKGLGLNHDETGIIASSNMFGYFLASLVAGILASRYGPRLIISLSLFWTGLSLALTALSGGLVSLAFYRFLTGVGSAGGNISMMGLSASWFSDKRRGMVNGILVGGSGLAMAVTGWIVPLVNGLYPDQGWRYNWLILGILVWVLGLTAALYIRNHPRDKELTPIGGSETLKGNLARDSQALSIREILSMPSVRVLSSAYFCFGMSYIIYTMFFVNYLIGEKGLDQIQAGGIWSLVGILSIGSAVIWGSLSDVIGRSWALAIVFGLQAISYLLPVLTTEVFFLWLSAIIFGLTAWSIPGIVASYCGDVVNPKNTPATLGLVTLFFGFGQVLGPTAAGYIKELSASFNGAFLLASALACLGLILSIRLNNNNKTTV